MARLHLPMAIGPREELARLSAEQHVPPTMVGERLVVTCRDLVVASESFVDELVHEMLVVRGASELALVGAGDDFVADVRRAAARHRVAERVARRRAVEVGV